MEREDAAYDTTTWATQEREVPVYEARTSHIQRSAIYVEFGEAALCLCRVMVALTGVFLR